MRGEDDMFYRLRSSQNELQQQSTRIKKRVEPFANLIFDLDASACARSQCNIVTDLSIYEKVVRAIIVKLGVVDGDGKSTLLLQHDYVVVK
jgi:hypothetical protein